MDGSMRAYCLHSHLLTRDSCKDGVSAVNLLVAQLTCHCHVLFQENQLVLLTDLDSVSKCLSRVRSVNATTQGLSY